MRVNTAHAGDRPQKSRGARGYLDVKGPLQRADGRSKPATPAKRFVRFSTGLCLICVCVGGARDLLSGGREKKPKFPVPFFIDVKTFFLHVLDTFLFLTIFLLRFFIVL